MSKIIYKGPAKLYLEGKSVLWPISNLHQNAISYKVGAINIPITVQDHRIESTRAAILVLEKKKSKHSFANSFNKPAFVEIIDSDNEINIELLDYPEKATNPVLWLGVIRDGEMPVHRIAWQILQPVNQKDVAFVALVKD